MFVMGSLATLALLFGDARSAAKIYEILLPYAPLMRIHGLTGIAVGSVESLLGRLSGALGRIDEAVAHLNRALERERAFGANPACQKTMALLALAERGSDAQRAGGPVAGAFAEWARW
jgi:hypothetical protein